MQDQTKQNRLITILTLVALVAMISAFFAPIWWVSLTAPNYPKDAFPDGIRIHFHFDVVKNGCSAVGASTRMGSETMQADMGPDSERYNPILDAKKDVIRIEAVGWAYLMEQGNSETGIYSVICKISYIQQP